MLTNFKDMRDHEKERRCNIFDQQSITFPIDFVLFFSFFFFKQILSRKDLILGNINIEFKNCSSFPQMNL